MTLTRCQSPVPVNVAGVPLTVPPVVPFSVAPLGPLAMPTVKITSDGTNLTITYTGTLQSADTVNGGYTDVTGASSPYTVNTSTGSKFFRARN